MRSVRPYPLLVSDIVRSWVAIGVAGVVMLAVALISSLVSADGDSVLRAGFYAAWTIFCAVYIALSVFSFGRSDAERLRKDLAASAPRDTGWARFWWGVNGGGAVWWALAGAVATFITLVELAISRASVSPGVAVLAVVVAVASLALIVVAFAVNYARDDATGGGLQFPGDEPPRFVDYIYFAAQVSTTFGGSDVLVTTSRMRRVLPAHGAIAFVFNSVIVALLVSVLIAGIR